MKLFYNDHIIANYMEEKFGIRYETLNGLPVKNINSIFYARNIPLEDGEKLYVRDEYKADFTPEVGDYVEINDGIAGKHVVRWNTSYLKHGHVLKPKIIMRDGKHFFMPEVE